MTKPIAKPQSNKFSSGPCAKRPGWNAEFLNKTDLLGRSHRSKEALNLINEVNALSLKFLHVPKDYKIAIIAASDTGAFECAMWNMLGERPIDVVYFEAFGAEWYKAITEQLRLLNVRKFSADFGKIPDLAAVNFDNDVVFTLNGTTSGVCINDLDFIPDNRKGLTFCDATSAAFSMPIDFNKLDITTYSWQKSLGGEAQHGQVGGAGRGAAQAGRMAQPGLQRLQQRRNCCVAVSCRRQAVTRLALGVLPAVQVALEVAVITLHQLQVSRRLRPRPPALRIGCGQGPAHDVPALVNHAAIGQMQHRDRCLG
jgi:hypothetical protein